MKSPLIYIIVVFSLILISVPQIECALPGGFVTVAKGSVQLTGKDRSVSVDASNTARMELDDTILTSDDIEGTFHLFDGSSFVPESRATYVVNGDGIFQLYGKRWKIVHGFLVTLSSGKINSAVPRGKQPVADWYSNGPLNADGSSVGTTEPVTSGKLANGQVMKSGSGTIIKINGGKRGIVLLSANSDLRLLPTGYGLEQGSGMLHLGPDSRHWLYTPYFKVTAVDAFIEVLAEAGGQRLKVLKGKAEVYVLEDALDNKWTSPEKRIVLRGGQSTIAGAVNIDKFGEKSALYAVAKDFISRLNENGLDGFSGEFIRSLSGNNQMSQVVAVEGPSLPPGYDNPTSIKTPVPLAPPVRSSKPIKVPVSAEKSANSALNPLNKKIPGESQSDWYTEN